jgi:uncharacterized protein (TIGR03437 family)
VKAPLLLIATLLCGGLASAQQVISGVLNNYSYVPAALPHHGIAQGSIFVIFGTGLANAATGLQSAPLRTTLEGVSAAVTVGGVTRSVILYYVTPTQVAGILPATTPIGAGTITVTNNGRTSAAAPIRVVQSAFGTLTLDGSGTGAAAVFDAANQLLGPANATHPGDVIVLYGTGAGPSTGDETIAQTQTNLANVPILVEIGGKPATVLYHGRTVFPGLDQINVVVPFTVNPGCSVSVVVASGSYISNFTTIPVAANGAACPAAEGGDEGIAVTPEEVSRWVGAGQFTTGSFGLTRQTAYTVSDGAGGAVTRTVIRNDIGSAGYNRVSGNLERLFRSNFYTPTPGSCTVTTGLTNPFPDLVYRSLDAGTPLTVTGPNGSRTLARQASAGGVIGYAAEVGNGTPGNYLDPGQYTMSGPGGPEIGSFSGAIRVAPELEWTNRASLESITRSAGVTVTWTGGEPTTLVTIQGQSFLTQGTQVTGTSFQCWARNTDRQFTIPATVLLTLPATQTISPAPGVSLLQRGSLALATVGRGARIQASGLDYGTLGSQFGVAQSTQWR